MKQKKKKSCKVGHQPTNLTCPLTAVIDRCFAQSPPTCYNCFLPFLYNSGMSVPGHQCLLSISVDAVGTIQQERSLLEPPSLMCNIWPFESAWQNSAPEPFRCSCKHLKGERGFISGGRGGDRRVQLHASPQFSRTVGAQARDGADVTFSAASANRDIKANEDDWL